jgi:hypothetical protein
MLKEQLTNEALKKNFPDNFTLARFIISAARYLIKAGHEVEASQLIRDIQKNPSLYTLEQLDLLENDEVGIEKKQ